MERECLKEDANVFWLFWNDVGMLYEHDLFVWSITSLSLEMSDVLQHDYECELLIKNKCTIIVNQFCMFYFYFLYHFINIEMF